MTRVVAIVPVRTGSTRVPHKGIRPFGDTTLLEHKIETLKKVRGLADIVVSSDGDLVLDIARRAGVSVHLRNEYYASSKCTGSEFFQNLAKSIPGDILVYSPPTSPFIKPETVERAIFKYKFEDCDSVATVHPVKHHMWLDDKPMNYDILNSPNSQDLPEIQRITYGVCINSNKNVIKCKNVVGLNPFLLEIDEIEAVDIDTMLDFRFAEYLFEQERANV
jgi:N-acylneuraminate cytidylyltransferase